MNSYHWLHVSKGRTILLQWCDLTSSTDGATSSGDGSTLVSASNTVKITIQNHISSETHTWDVYATWEIEPKNLRGTQMTSHGGVSGQNMLFILALMCFLWNNLWLSFCNMANHWLLEPGWDGQQHLTAPIWKCVSGIGDHRFTFLMDLLSNYTFHTNLTIFSIKRLLIEEMTSLIVFNLWKFRKLCNIVWCRFNAINSWQTTPLNMFLSQ